MQLRKLRLPYLLFITGTVLAITLSFCTGSDKPAVGTAANPEAGSPYQNIADTSAQYVGMQECRKCHENIYQTFSQTGMGQSFDNATRQKSAANFDPKVAHVYDKNLNLHYQPYWDRDSFFIMEYRLDGTDTVHKRVEKVSYIVGSGQHTNSHIISRNGYLYQAPITFYTQKGRWDLAPGFEDGKNTRFDRKIELECMTCHNGYPSFEMESMNKFYTLKTGIDCERCHGPGSIHVKNKLEGNIVDTSKGADYTIVNPGRLSTEAQNNLCQRCHLQGIATLNDNKTFFDFKPSMQLKDVMSVFMPLYHGGEDKMIMASHVERMKMSECYINSNKMSCITCHNPHISVKATPEVHFNQSCKNCHGGGQQQCTAPMAERNAKNDNCVTCHMPKNSSIDIPHVAVTDHYIRKRITHEDQSKVRQFIGIKSYNNDNPDALTIARGYMELHERYITDPSLLDSAQAYLGKVPSDNPAAVKDRIRLSFLKNDYNAIVNQATSLPAAQITDAWTAYRVGEAMSQTGKTPAALPYYQRAVAIWPYALDFQSKLGVAYLQANNLAEARKTFEFILKEDPEYQLANNNLGYIYMQEGNMGMAFHYLSRSLMLNPDHEQTLINLAVFYHSQHNDQKARLMLQRVLKINPGHEQAKAMLLDIS